jgi:hypothetical protein
LGCQQPKAEFHAWEKEKEKVGFTCACAEKVEEESFKKKSFSIFRALKLGQIQMKFEFNLKQPCPTLNQKQEASA